MVKTSFFHDGNMSSILIKGNIKENNLIGKIIVSKTILRSSNLRSLETKNYYVKQNKICYFKN